MTREETKALLQKIQVHYWRFFKDMPREYVQITLDEWHRFLGRYKTKYIVEALDICIKESEFPPTIKDIVEQIPHIERKVLRERTLNTPQLTCDNAVPMPDDVKEKLRAWLK